MARIEQKKKNDKGVDRMTLGVWIFCLLISTGAFLGALLLEFQTMMLVEHAMGKTIYFMLGSVATAFYFTCPGFSERPNQS